MRESTCYMLFPLPLIFIVQVADVVSDWGNVNVKSTYPGRRFTSWYLRSNKHNARCRQRQLAQPKQPKFTPQANGFSVVGTQNRKMFSPRELNAAHLSCQYKYYVLRTNREKYESIRCVVCQFKPIVLSCGVWTKPYIKP